MLAALRILSWIVRPIAAPAWFAENAWSRLSRRRFRFSVFSGSAYFLVLLGLSIAALTLTDNVILWCVALYLVASLQLVGWTVAALIPIGNSGAYRSALQEIARRDPTPSSGVDLSGSAIWTALSCYGYTATAFGVLAYSINRFDPGAYNGAPPEAVGVGTLFDFVYTSFVMILTSNYTEITPAVRYVKAIAVLEFAIGLLFSLLIFSLFVEQLTRRRFPGT